MKIFGLEISGARFILVSALFLLSTALKAEVPPVVDSIPACDTLKAVFDDGASFLVGKIMDFSVSMNENYGERKSDAYIKWRIHTVKRNVIMKLIPSLYVITKENPDYIKEYYRTVWFNDAKAKEKTDRASAGTIPIKNKVSVPIMDLYTPDIYAKTFFKENILSPFNRTNRKFYRYKITRTTDSTAELAFKPRLNNPQLIKGAALVDKNTGEILSTSFAGEYDLFRFKTDMDMNKEIPVLPERNNLKVSFSFMGNKLLAEVSCQFLPPKDFPDSAEAAYSMGSLRPFPLDSMDRSIYSRYDSLQTLKNPDKSQASRNYKKAWKIVQETFANSLTADLGADDKLSLKFSPLVNPSYLNYSHNRGLSYRYDIRGLYRLGDNSGIYTKIKLGYMFTKKQFYFDAPFFYSFDAARHGTISFSVGNGNRITNSSVREQLIKKHPESVRFNDMDLNYYTDNYYSLNLSYDLTPWFRSEVGAMYHRRTPVNKKEFTDAGQPVTYKTFAPCLELTFLSFKGKGPVLTLDYEAGIKGVMKSGVAYEKIEGDLSWIKNFSSVSSLSMRVGGGLYTDRSQDIYFLDFSNFRENNLPGGWNDDWSGEFQLLNSAWYNISKYYYRTNLTYEQPMMLSYVLPFIRKGVEKERFYANFLLTDRIHPYAEYGYALTNSLFSMGIYISTRDWKYQDLGFRFSIELFSRWR